MKFNWITGKKELSYPQCCSIILNFTQDIDLIYGFASKKNPLSAVAATFIFKIVGKYLKFF